MIFNTQIQGAGGGSVPSTVTATCNTYLDGVMYFDENGAYNIVGVNITTFQVPAGALLYATMQMGYSSASVQTESGGGVCHRVVNSGKYSDVLVSVPYEDFTITASY